MESRREYEEYLNCVKKFIALNFDVPKVAIHEILKQEPTGRVAYSAQNDSVSLGMASWPLPKIIESLKEIQSAIVKALDCVVKHSRIEEEELNLLNSVRHDLKIQHSYSPKSASGMKLGYVVPDSKIAWDEGKCPYCGESVKIHLFPDPIPIQAYEALINTLRLLTRNIPIVMSENQTYEIGELNE